MSTDDPQRALTIRRLHWSSRRGLLELDLFLEPFLADGISHLSDEQLADYERMMFEDDNTLIEWLHQREVAQDPKFRALVETIRRIRLQPR